MILRSSRWLSLAFALIAHFPHLGLVHADADFESVRIRLDYPYRGGRGGDPQEKYWRKFTPYLILNQC